MLTSDQFQAFERVSSQIRNLDKLVTEARKICAESDAKVELAMELELAEEQTRTILRALKNISQKS